ncbi:Uncharacterised protein [Streptococcus sanguinis]|uniref:Uncharacterized protein n=1 Tax=Streptococcus sanguinis TaxID=1305 RepID=A0A2X3YFX3_STRSA|nr:Uncharacterised protein [Streptococcus sanguinis]
MLYLLLFAHFLSSFLQLTEQFLPVTHAGQPLTEKLLFLSQNPL